MYIVVVSVHVKDENREDFLKATRRNVGESLKERGIKRFDVLREAQNPSHFLLMEVYVHADDHDHHKDSPHYKQWVQAVQPLMAEPRTRVIYESCFQRESGWE